jgi:hypothetical protein
MIPELQDFCRRHILLPVIFLFCCNPLLAQKNTPFEVKWGKGFEGAKRSYLQDLIGHDQTGFYVTTGKQKTGEPTDGSYQIQYFGHDLTLKRSKEIELKTDGRYESIEAFAQLRNEIYLFTSQANFKTKKQSLYVRKLNKATLDAEPKGRRVAEMPTPSGLVINPGNLGNFSVRLSHDSTRVMIFYALPYKKGEPEKFGVHVFDDALAELWHRDIMLPYRDELFGFVSMKVSNDGQVFILGKYYKDKAKEVRQGKPNYEYKILSYSATDTKGREYSVKVGEKFVTDMQIGLLDNGDVACAGFYSDEGTNSIRGTFFLRIDGSTAQIESSNFKEFDIDFLTQNMTDRQAEKLKKKEERDGDVEMYEYDLRELVMREDGGVVMMGERYFVHRSSYTTYNNGVPTTHTNITYNYEDIIAVSVNAGGTIDWARILPKRQTSGGAGTFYFSYLLGVVGDKLYVLYNDDPKNIDFKMPGKPKVLAGTEESIIMVNQIDATGKVTRYPIFSSFGADVSFWPTVSEQVSENELILFAKRKRDQQFVRITFK